MNLPPNSDVFFVMICMLFFIVRTYFYMQLWDYKDAISKNGQYPDVFPKGLKKFMVPINITGEIKEKEINSIIKKVNLFNYLEYVAAFIAFLITFTQK